MFSSAEERLVAFASLVVISLIWLLYKVGSEFILLFLFRSKNYIQYITSLPDENTIDADWAQEQCGCISFGLAEGDLSDPNYPLSPCLIGADEKIGF